VAGGVLDHEVYVPAGASEGVPVVILLHGRGAERTDLFTLRRHMPSGWAVLAPDAPFPGAPWGYGPGYAWYQFMGRNRPEPASFQESLKALDRFMDALPELIGRAPGPVALGGFSQGGTMSVGYALSRPGRIPHVLNFSGFVADHPAVNATAETVRGTRFFWGHGRSDPAIPFELAIEGRRLLEEVGADVESRDYAIGHWIDPTELSDAVAWLERGFGP
jgi:phospholipase/carboxylesterase